MGIKEKIMGVILAFLIIILMLYRMYLSIMDKDTYYYPFAPILILLAVFYIIYNRFFNKRNKKD